MIAIRFREKLPALTATGLFALFVVLHLVGEYAIADRWIAWWRVGPYPFRFLDTDTVLSAVRCFNQGIDAYSTNPCDDLGRVYTYSPLWMRALMPFPVDEKWIIPAGLAVDLAFLASLFLLPPMRSWRMAAIVTLGAVSSASIFAMERGNNDLVLFTLVCITAALAARSPALRYLGYSAALLAGLLKYYPMAVMALAMREKPGRFFWVAGASIAVTGFFVAMVWSDLWKAFANIPEGSWWHDMFGSETLGGGLAQLNGWPEWSETAIGVVLSLSAFAAAARIAGSERFEEALEGLSRREWDFLLVGSLIAIGCFFTAQNIGYRAVHILLALPGLVVIGRGRGLLIAGAPYVGLALMWSMFWRDYGFALAGWMTGQDHQIVFFLLWMLREVLWWWLIVLYAAFAIHFARHTPVVQFLMSHLARSGNSRFREMAF